MHGELHGHLITEILRTNGGVVEGLITPVRPHSDLFAVGRHLDHDGFDGDVGVHRGGNGLAAKRRHNSGDRFPDRIGRIHRNWAVDFAHRNGDRLANG